MSGTRLSDLPIIDERGLRALLPYSSAVMALESALRDGSAPGPTPPRHSVTVAHGEVIILTGASARYVGVRLNSLAPGNANIGLPRYQGVYTLFDALTLTPRALIDSAALTVWRAPAVSAMVIRHLTQQAPLRLVVIGTGPQAYGHVEAIASVRPIAHLTIGGRNRSQTERFAVWAAGQGLPTMVVAGSELPDDLQGPIHEADVVVCATSSAHPVFSSAWLTTPSIVIAMGSQNPQHREVDSNLVAGGTVIVESRAAALEASGDILIPMAERRGGPDLINADLVELIHGWVNIPLDRPVLFSGVGEAWQDLVLASAVFDALVETAAHQGQ